jgi:hypothetical protein
MEEEQNFRIVPPESDQDVEFLPYNYFPAALAALRGDPLARNRHLFVLPLGDNSQSGALSYVISAKRLSTPIATSDFITSLEPSIDRERANQICFLGPETDLEETSQPRIMSFDVAEVNANAPIERVVVVIDNGIAFWNRRFRSNGTSRFTEIRYLDFERTTPNVPLPVGRVTSTDIAALCSLSDGPLGQFEIMKALKRQFPRSFFGSNPSPDPDGLWHGTAIADIAAPDDGGKTALFAVELPDASVRDWGGTTLQTVLPLALQTALAMTGALSHLPLIIVLPFAFTAGPHTGSHPIALSIASELSTARGQRSVALVLPAGNHLQDQCCAQLQPTWPEAAAKKVNWHLPPDDFSANTIEMIVENTALGPIRPKITVTLPNGKQASAELLQNKIATLKLGPHMIGQLVRAANFDGRARYRLVIEPTGWLEQNRRPAPFGDWSISIDTNQLAMLWVLRDERDTVADMATPRRTSFFTDPGYVERDASGAYLLTDPQTGPLRRSGTASVLTTAINPMTVQAQERFGSEPAHQAWYSGRAQNGGNFDMSVLVDDGFKSRGLIAIGNGTDREFRISGTSAAAARAVRDI